MLIISGLQLSIAWIVMRVLEELAQREASVRRDLTETGVIHEEVGGILTRGNEPG